MTSFEITLPLALAWSSAAVLLLAFALSAVFLRGRAALAALVLLWAWAGLGIPAGIPPLAALPPPRLEAVLLFVPLDLLLLACIVETVVLSRTAALLVLLLAVQTALAWLLPDAYWDRAWIWERLPSRWLGEAFATRGLPPPGLSAFLGLLAAAVAALRARRDGDVVLAGVAVAALVSAWLGYGLLTGVAPHLPLAIGGLALLCSAGWASYRMAFLDALTGLPGRRVLDERMARLGRRWSVAMIDVDHFKKFNDRYGHDVGDQVLRMVAAKLRRHFGANAYRYGDEEFSVLFPGRSERDARARCEAFREDVAAHEMMLRAEDRPARAPKKGAKAAAGKGAKTTKGGGKKAPKPVSVTVSIGIAPRTARRRRPEVVLKAADVALYRAKDGGRNQVVEHD